MPVTNSIPDDIWRCGGCDKLREELKYHYFDGKRVCVECYAALIVGLRTGGMNTTH